MSLIALYKTMFYLKKKQKKSQQPDFMDKSICFYYCSLAVFMEIDYYALRVQSKFDHKPRKTCFVLSLLLIALPAVITRL